MSAGGLDYHAESVGFAASDFLYFMHFRTLVFDGEQCLIDTCTEKDLRAFDFFLKWTFMVGNFFFYPFTFKFCLSRKLCWDPVCYG